MILLKNLSLFPQKARLQKQPGHTPSSDGMRAGTVRFGQMGANWIIAHRGAQICKAMPGDKVPDTAEFIVYPENTLAAFKAALEKGHDIELDVNTNGALSFQRNKQTVMNQGRPLPFLPVYHDDQLGNPFRPQENVHDTMVLRNSSTDTILNARFWKEGLITRVIEKRLGTKEQFRPETPRSRVLLNDTAEATRIPTLDEVFTLLKQYPHRHAYVEIKTLTHGDEENTKGLEKKLLEMMEEFNVTPQVTIISFNRYVLERVKNMAEQLKLNAVTTAWDIEPDSYLKKKGSMEELLSWAANHVNAILPTHGEVTPHLLDAAHKRGLLVMSWTDNETRTQEINALQRLRKMGIDGVITNIPSDAEEVYHTTAVN